MFSEPNIVSVLVQAGCVGISLVTLAILYRLLCIGSKLMDNHMVHIFEALSGMNEKMDRLVSAIETSNRGALRSAKSAARAAKKVAVVAEAVSAVAHKDIELGVDSPRHE